MDQALRAFGTSWAGSEKQLREWLRTRDPQTFAQVQASLADILRNLLPIDDPFARERVVLVSLQHFRESLLTVDLVDADTAYRLAQQAWSKEAFRVRTLMNDQNQAVAREQAFDVIDGLTWTWRTKLDERTCPYCVAMHGTVHPIGVPMVTHPNCRCMPVTEGLGSGWAWLRAQTVAVQDTILGRPVAVAWRAGKLGPEHIIDYAKHRRFPYRTIFGEKVRRALRRDAARKRMRVGVKRRTSKRG
jgi:hypothetical protein